MPWGNSSRATAQTLVGSVYGPYALSGLYIGGGSSGTIAPTLNEARFCPFWIPRTVTLTEADLNVTAAIASDTYRFGIWVDGGGYPTTLVADYGTFDTSTTGVKTMVISQALTPGLYWYSAVPQGGASAATVSAVSTTPFGVIQIQVQNPSSDTRCWSVSGVSGALASVFASPPGVSNASTASTPLVRMLIA
jgi:hypothetical protein